MRFFARGAGARVLSLAFAVLAVVPTAVVVVAFGWNLDEMWGGA